MDFAKTLILIVTLLGLLAQTIAVRTPQARVWSICKPTTNPLLCNKTILPKVGAKFNIYKALEIEVNATQKQVLRTVDWIAGISKANKPDRFEDIKVTRKYDSAYASCKVQYNNIVRYVAEIVKLVSQRNVAEARLKFRAVLSNHAACNGEFGGLVSSIAADAKAVFDLSSNCLDIMKAIEDRGIRRSGKN